MKEYKTICNKDFWSRSIIILNGIMLLIFLNFIFFGYIYEYEFNFLYVLGIIFFGIVFWLSVRLANNLYYEFREDGINIILPSGKYYLLEKSNIDKIENVGKLSIINGFGIRYNFFTGDILFTSGFNKAIRIYMKDGRKILITPRIIKDELFDFYS